MLAIAISIVVGYECARSTTFILFCQSIMLNTLSINNFRCFPKFELQDLGTINLLVGKNNSGKTTIIEAIYLLSSQTYLEALIEILINRGEYNNVYTPRERKLLDIKHLFYGHRMDIDSQFSILGKTNGYTQQFTVNLGHAGDQRKSLDLQEQKIFIQLSNKEDQIKLPLYRDGYLSDNRIAHTYKYLNDHREKTQFVTPYYLADKKMVELFDKLVLTPEERLVIEALQIIEPTIERIATVSYKEGQDGEFVVLLSGNEQPIPIGSMGDGIRKILGLVLTIINAKNGTLLVDEIDLGLHFSTMFDMWKLIWRTAKRLNVQVFATTHSSDCWTSLATIIGDQDQTEKDITIHRIEKGKSKSIVFDKDEIVIAAERGIEVR